MAPTGASDGAGEVRHLVQESVCALYTEGGSDSGDEIFRQVTVDTAAGAASWLNGIDLDPDILHGDHEPATGLAAKRPRQYRLQDAR